MSDDPFAEFTFTHPTFKPPKSVLIYGEPKVGKTTLAGTIANVEGYERILHIDMEESSSPLEAVNQNITVWEVPEGDVNAVNRMIGKLLDNPDHWDAVIFDTVSTYQKWVMDDLLRKSGKVKPEFDHWNSLQLILMDLMWELHRMKPLAFSTFHTKVEKDDLRGEILTSPYVQGSARHSIGAVPDMLFRITINGKGQRVLQASPQKGVVSGNRYEHAIHGQLLTDDEGGPVTMQYLFELMRGEKSLD